MKISEQLVQMYCAKEFDTTILTVPASLVNIRLFKLGKQYRDIILEIVKYMDEHLNEKFEDWKEPIGVAAPALGFPLCIIGYKYAATGNSKFQYCLNPKITSYAGTEVTTFGNCGSLQLKEPVTIIRYSMIDFDYYDLEGKKVSKKSITRTDGSLVIQNLTDAINGITVEKRKELGKEKRTPYSTYPNYTTIQDQFYGG